MSAMTYIRCRAMAATSKRKLGNNTYLVVEEGERPGDDPIYHIKLHNTNIVTFYSDDSITLNSGGWRTVTTKQRINDHTNASISQSKGIWSVGWMGNLYNYADGIRLLANGEALNAGPSPDTAIRKRRRLLRYVQDYVQALDQGKVPAPSQGDCFYCQMIVTDGNTGKVSTSTDHLLSHMTESYFVPSLLMNAMRERPTAFSQVAAAYVACKWQGVTTPFFPDIAKAQVRKGLFDYMARRLGYTPTVTRYAP